MRSALGCALHTLRNLVDRFERRLAEHIYVGMLQKLIAPRTPSTTLCNSLIHWPDLRSVLDLRAVRVVHSEMVIDIPFMEDDATPVPNNVV